MFCFKQAQYSITGFKVKKTWRLYFSEYNWKLKIVTNLFFFFFFAKLGLISSHLLLEKLFCFFLLKKDLQNWGSKLQPIHCWFCDAKDKSLGAKTNDLKSQLIQET